MRCRIRSRAVAATLSLVLLTPLLAQEATPPGYNSKPAVTGLDSWGHAVTDLDASIKFYRDGLGLDLVGTAPKEATSNASFQQLVGVSNAKTRSVRFRIPHLPYDIELVEYSGVARAPVRAMTQDALGSPFMNIGYLDLTPVYAGLNGVGAKDLNGQLVPAAPPSARRGPLWIRDPDGFQMEVLAGGWDPEKRSLYQVKNAFTGHFGGTEVSPEQALEFWRDLLGFNVQAGFLRTSSNGLGIYVEKPIPPGEYVRTGPMAAIFALPEDSSWAAIEGYCAGARCEWFSYKGGRAADFRPNPQDPGAAFLSVWVRDIDKLLAQVNAKGLEILTTGKRPVRFNGARQILIRNSAGMLVLLMQQD